MPLTDEGAPPELPEKPGKIAVMKDMGLSGLSFLERIASWVYLLPLILIIGAIYWLGFRLIYIAVLIGACFVWNFWGRRMAMRDPKLVLEVNIERQEVNPIYCGRKLWARLEKKGKPAIPMRTPGGLSVEVVRNFDPGNNVVEYPVSSEFSDLMLAAIPERYGALIDELVMLHKENYELGVEGSLYITRNGLKKGKEYGGKLNAILEEMIEPCDPKKPEAPKA